MNRVYVSNTGNIACLTPDDVITFPGTVYLGIDSIYVFEEDSELIHNGNRKNVKKGQVLITFYNPAGSYVLIDNDDFSQIVLEKQNKNKKINEERKEDDR